MTVATVAKDILSDSYHRKNNDRGSEKVISAATLVDRLKWFNEA
jgi:hypothetical protein